MRLMRKTLWLLYQWHIQELAGVRFWKPDIFRGGPEASALKYAITFLHHHSAQWYCNSVGVSKIKRVNLWS